MFYWCLVIQPLAFTDTVVASSCTHTVLFKVCHEVLTNETSLLRYQNKYVTYNIVLRLPQITDDIIYVFIHSDHYLYSILCWDANFLEAILVYKRQNKDNVHSSRTLYLLCFIGKRITSTVASPTTTDGLIPTENSNDTENAPNPCTAKLDTIMLGKIFYRWSLPCACQNCGRNTWFRRVRHCNVNSD